jgi:hypothetical protein
MDKKDNYAAALSHARGEFLKRSPFEMASRTRLPISSDGSAITVPYLYEDFLVDCHTAHVLRLSDGREATRSETVDILHHLFYCQQGAGPTGEWVHFRDLKGCGHFNSAFEAMTMPLLQRAFGGSAEKFRSAAKALKGEEAAFGDASVKLDIFPIFPVAYIMWEGDDEFAPNYNVLFDKSAVLATHPEDVPGLGTLGAAKLAESAGRL